MGWLIVQMILPIVLAALLAGAVMVYFYADYIREKKLRLRVQKLYASQLFLDMTPMLHYARRNPIERLTVDKTGVAIRYLHSEREAAFMMRPNGYSYLTPQQQEAMRTVLEECLPKIGDQSNYHVNRKRVTLLNGDVEYLYRYTMTSAYKAKIAMSEYYDGSLSRSTSW